ncbi:MAG: GNAT family N-acetyltransferase [Chloroflexota bacterium]|nr:GNAT family N-acetyltransferase [Chloroflexota bacterium]
MTDADVGVALYIGREAMDGLRRSQGQQVEPWQPTAPSTQRHLLGTDPGGAWIAEINGVPVGYALSLVRGHIWFLSQLFVQPDQHGHGVGGALLERAQTYGREGGARIFSVIALGSPAAHGLYMRAGMFAVGIGYRMIGPLEPLLALPQADANKKRIVDCSGWQDRIAGLDREVFGAERRQDHAYYLRNDGFGEHGSFGLSRDGDLLGYGYAYAYADGAYIAPLAAYEPPDQLPLLRMAAEWLIEHEASTASMLVLSANKTIMGALLAAGWRSQGWTFLMTSGPFGKFDRYHPAGGALL